MKTFIAIAVLLAASLANADNNSSSIEFVIQTLEPTGGKIFRPKEWFYAERHNGHAYRWLLTRENLENNQGYITGVQIQTFVGVEKNAGETPERFIRKFVASKSASSKVVSSCEATDQGLFTRLCLETEEGPFHIQYSLYWGNDGMDIAVVYTAGTAKELWDTYLPIFSRMDSFELIDMSRFEK